MTDPIYDIHTHDAARRNAIVNLPLLAGIPQEGIFSAGIHPWDTDRAGHQAEEWLEKAAFSPAVAAIGETGLDGLRGGPAERQMALLRLHAVLAEAAHKPMIIHNVRGTDHIVALHRELRPTQPWIIHGFRGKPQLARQLVREGFFLSLGERFNPDAAAEVPPERLLIESDESPLPIAEIAARVGVPLRDLTALLH